MEEVVVAFKNLAQGIIEILEVKESNESMVVVCVVVVKGESIIIIMELSIN
jgi:hypothetical protein